MQCLHSFRGKLSNQHLRHQIEGEGMDRTSAAPPWSMETLLNFEDSGESSRRFTPDPEDKDWNKEKDHVASFWVGVLSGFLTHGNSWIRQ